MIVKMTIADALAHNLRVEMGRKLWRIETAVSLMAEAREKDVKKRTQIMKTANGKSESDIQSEIEKHLQSLGPCCWHVRCRMNSATTFTRQGIPDFIILHGGKLISLEVKKPGAKPTVEQCGELHWIRLAGGRAAVVHSLAEAVAFLSA